VSAYEQLIQSLVQSGVLRNERLIGAFHAVDRRDFVPEEHKYLAYGDFPLPIGYNSTISQPSTVAFMLELLDVEEGNRVLDIGAGSGWTTALLAALTTQRGQVIGTELVPEHVVQANKRLQKYNCTHAHVIPAASTLGVEAEQFDRILVSASAVEFPHQLLEQLKPGGKLVIPVNSSIILAYKNEHTYSWWEYPGFAFVPLLTDSDRVTA
jgi:protein-L-isoaspartate(D-aspartate) O-methyltransferase